MAPISHRSHLSQLSQRVSRRTLLSGSAAAAGAALVAPRVGAAKRSAFPAPAVLKQQKAKIRIAQFGSIESAERTKTFLAEFQAEQPEIEIDVYPVEAPDWSGYFAKILTQIAGGEPPDICSVATEGTQLFAARLAAPLDDFVKRDQEEMREYFADVAPSLVEAMMYEGSLYELPFDFNAANIFYNTNRFEEAGVPLPTEDWTKDQFADAATKLAGDGRYGFVWTNRHWGGSIPWMFVNESNILTEEKSPGGEWLWETFYADDPGAQGRGGGWSWAKSQANDAKNVEALQFLVDLTYELEASPSPAEADSQQAQAVALFGGGQVAMFPAGSYIIRSLAESGIGPDDFDVTYMPKWKSQRHQFGTAGLVIMKDSPNQEAAWEVLKYRVRPEVISRYVEGGRTTPARRSLATEQLWTPELGPKNHHVFYDTLDAFPDTAPIPAPPPAVEVANVLTRYVGLALSRDNSPQEALDAMHQELETVLARPI